MCEFSACPCAADPCDEENGGCDHICVPIGDGKASCRCAIGFRLDRNGKVCNSGEATCDSFHLCRRNQLDRNDWPASKFCDIFFSQTRVTPLSCSSRTHFTVKSTRFLCRLDLDEKIRPCTGSTFRSLSSSQSSSTWTSRGA